MADVLQGSRQLVYSPCPCEDDYWLREKIAGCSTRTWSVSFERVICHEGSSVFSSS